jgi:hypothetical protein
MIPPSNIAGAVKLNKLVNTRERRKLGKILMGRIYSD